MIRHSSSFFVSIIFHILLVLILFYGYKSIVHVEEISERRVKISLCNIEESKTIVQKIKPISPPKKLTKVEKKVIPQIIKPKIKKIIKKKEIIEKPTIIPKQKIEKKEKIIKKETPVKEEVLIKESLVEVQKNVHVETKKEKDLRLEKDYINEHIQKITQLLRDNLYYPRSARKRGITGNIHVKFKLLLSGEVTDIKVVNSQSDILSRAAIKTIQNLSNQFPTPSEELLLHVPINYNLK